MASNEIAGNYAGDNASVNRKTAASDIQYFSDITGIVVPTKNHIVGSGADNRHGNEPNGEIKNVFAFNAVPRRPLIAKKNCQKKAETN